MKKWLTEEPTIKFAMLFGYFAKGNSRPGSDIDLAIELDTPLSTENKLDILQSLSEITDKKIDSILRGIERVKSHTKYRLSHGLLDWFCLLTSAG